jgi:hypothetical protein
MPLLDTEIIGGLLAIARGQRAPCACGGAFTYDYCRSCDEYYWLHSPGCTLYEPKHHGHRLTIVPFVEV